MFRLGFCRLRCRRCPQAPWNTLRALPCNCAQDVPPMRHKCGGRFHSRRASPCGTNAAAGLTPLYLRGFVLRLRSNRIALIHPQSNPQRGRSLRYAADFRRAAFAGFARRRVMEWAQASSLRPLVRAPRAHTCLGASMLRSFHSLR